MVVLPRLGLMRVLMGVITPCGLGPTLEQWQVVTECSMHPMHRSLARWIYPCDGIGGGSSHRALKVLHIGGIGARLEDVKVQEVDTNVLVSDEEHDRLG